MRIQLDKPVSNTAFEERFQGLFSPLQTTEFEEEFETYFAQVGYFCDQQGEFDFVKFARWLEIRFFVDTSKRQKFNDLDSYIERILTFFIGSEALRIWNKLTHCFTCPKDMELLDRVV